MASETLSQFVKNFEKLGGDAVDSKLLSDWNKETSSVMSDAQDKAPLASGQLVRSAVQQRAVKTKNGIKSSYEFTVPYAKKLNDKRSGVRLKERGEISHYSGGVQWKKANKGELGYSDNAIEDAERGGEFVKAVDEFISRVWRKL
jgi:hypothetical protein